MPLLHSFLMRHYFINFFFHQIGLVKLHKYGKIWAESEGEGKGCTFFVQLPLHAGNCVAPAANSSKDVTSLIPNITPMQIAEAFVEEQAEIDDQPVSSPPSALVQPVVTIVAATWKPTVLVVDDSAMNRKVDKFTHPPSLPLSVTMSSPMYHFVLALSNHTHLLLRLPCTRCWFAC